MKAHELARALLAGPDMEVRRGAGWLYALTHTVHFPGDCLDPKTCEYTNRNVIGFNIVCPMLVVGLWVGSAVLACFEPVDLGKKRG